MRNLMKKLKKSKSRKKAILLLSDNTINTRWNRMPPIFLFKLITSQNSRRSKSYEGTCGKGA
jgi:hypothetical protein